MWTGFLRRKMSSLRLVPPVVVIHSILMNFEICLMTEAVYRASSLVGTSIKAYIYSSYSSIQLRMGIKKAAVLPVPFLALAMTLFWVSIRGITSS